MPNEYESDQQRQRNPYGRAGTYGEGIQYGQGSHYGQTGQYGGSDEYSEAGQFDRDESWRDRAREGMHDARDRAREGYHRAQEAGHRARERMSDARSRISARSRDLAREARIRGRRAAHQIEDTYEYGKHRLEEGLDRHPLAVGLGFFAVGLLVGLSIPRTRREHEWFGDTSEGLIDRARERGSELMHRGVEAGRRTFDAAREEMRDQGLTPRQLREKSRRVVDEGMDAAREAAREEGLTSEELARRADELRETAQTSAQREVERLQRQH